MPVKYPKKAGEHYTPSSGTEGELFMNAWCKPCTKQQGCTIPLTVMAGRLSKAWKYGDSGEPVCLSFSDERTPRHEPRCKLTADLFND